MAADPGSIPGRGHRARGRGGIHYPLPTILDTVDLDFGTEILVLQ